MTSWCHEQKSFELYTMKEIIIQAYPENFMPLMQELFLINMFLSDLGASLSTGTIVTSRIFLLVGMYWCVRQAFIRTQSQIICLGGACINAPAASPSLPLAVLLERLLVVNVISVKFTLRKLLSAKCFTLCLTSCLVAASTTQLRIPL